METAIIKLKQFGTRYVGVTPAGAGLSVGTNLDGGFDFICDHVILDIGQIKSIGQWSHCCNLKADDITDAANQVASRLSYTLKQPIEIVLD